MSFCLATQIMSNKLLSDLLENWYKAKNFRQYIFFSNEGSYFNMSPFSLLLLVMQSYTDFIVREPVIGVLWKNCSKIIAKFSGKHLRESPLIKTPSSVHNLIKHLRRSFFLKQLTVFSFQSLTILAKSSNLDVWQDSKYASACKFGEVFEKSYTTEFLQMAASVWPQFLMERHLMY